MMSNRRRFLIVFIGFSSVLVAVNAQDSLLVQQQQNPTQLELVDTSLLKSTAPSPKYVISNKNTKKKAISYLKSVPLDSLQVRDSILLNKFDSILNIKLSKLGIDRSLINNETYDEVFLQKLYWLGGIFVLVMLLVCFSIITYLLKRINKVNDVMKSFQDSQPQIINALADEISNKISVNGITNNSNVSVTNVNKKEITDIDISAFNDGVQAFVNINNYIYDLRKYNEIILPLMKCMSTASEDIDHAKKLVGLETLSEEERSEISLLVAKIEQFKKNNLSAIIAYLEKAGNNYSFDKCIRFPLGMKFSKDQDQHILGEDLDESYVVERVFKLGFYFPTSKSYPYREKSLIL